jgi:serine/threonine protein kinase
MLNFPPMDAKNAQAWFERRLHGVPPTAFESGVRIYVNDRMQAPSGYEHVVTRFNSENLEETMPSVEEAMSIHAVAIFAHPGYRSEVDSLINVVVAFDNLGQQAPPLFWVPHTVAPEERAGENTSVNVDDARELYAAGLDGIIDSEPVGFDLALKFRAKVHKSAELARTLSRTMNQRRQESAYANLLKDCIHDMLWDYGRTKLAPSIPILDPNVVTPVGRAPRVIDGQTVGALLGKGMFGSVYSIAAQTANGTHTTEVVKLVSKDGVGSLMDVRTMGRMIDVMTLLSSPQWAHPNVNKLRQVYHTQDYIIFRLEYAGSENLYKRLSARSKLRTHHRPLPFARTVSLICQAIRAICYLHLGPKVCHRDIKPENLVVSETSEELNLKVVDFDLAVMQDKDDAVCRTPCGTMPFTAPEVLLDGEYRGRPADIWSLAVVLLEILCGLRVVEQVMGLNALSNSADDAIAQRIKKAWSNVGAPGQLLEMRILEELRPLLPAVTELIDMSLLVDPVARWSAARVQEAGLALAGQQGESA